MPYIFLCWVTILSIYIHICTYIRIYVRTYVVTYRFKIIIDTCICLHTYLYSCKELPEEDFCFTLLPSNHFAPGTSEISANPSDLNDEISQINELMEFTTCGELLNTLNCLVKYPACSADTKKLIPICDTQCLLIDVQIKQCLINLEDKFPGSDFPLVKNLLRSIECDEAETYYNFPFQYIEANSTNCLMLSKLCTVFA